MIRPEGRRQIRRCLRESLWLPFGVMLLAPFALSTSPLPPPYYRYELHGRVQTADGRPAQGILIVVYARTAYDSTLWLAGYTGRDGDRPLGVSSGDGSFALSVSTTTRAESLSIGMTAPGKVLALSHAFHPDSALAWPVKKKGMSMDERGCSGCGTGPSTIEYVEYYRCVVSQDVVLH